MHIRREARQGTALAWKLSGKTCAVQRCGVATLDRILRCCWWIPARDFEVKAESEEGVADDKKGSQLEVRGGIL